MATKSELASIVDDYLSASLRNDPDSVVALFADDAEIEDPIGATPVVGRKAIAAFYAISRDVKKLRRIGPLTVFGDHVGVQFRATLGVNSVIDVPGMSLPFDVTITEIFAFNADGKIKRMTAIPDLELTEEETMGRDFA